MPQGRNLVLLLIFILLLLVIIWLLIGSRRRPLPSADTPPGTGDRYVEERPAALAAQQRADHGPDTGLAATAGAVGAGAVGAGAWSAARGEDGFEGVDASAAEVTALEAEREVAAADDAVDGFEVGVDGVLPDSRLVNDADTLGFAAAEAEARAAVEPVDVPALPDLSVDPDDFDLPERGLPGMTTDDSAAADVQEVQSEDGATDADLPEVAVVQAETPAADEPEVDAAHVDVVGADVPSVDVPEVSGADIHALSVDVPEVEVHEVDLADVGESSVELPDADGADAVVPSIDGPEVALADVGESSVELPDADGADAVVPSTDGPEVDAVDVTDVEGAEAGGVGGDVVDVATVAAPTSADGILPDSSSGELRGRLGSLAAGAAGLAGAGIAGAASRIAAFRQQRAAEASERSDPAEAPTTTSAPTEEVVTAMTLSDDDLNGDSSVDARGGDVAVTDDGDAAYVDAGDAAYVDAGDAAYVDAGHATYVDAGDATYVDAGDAVVGEEREAVVSADDPAADTGDVVAVEESSWSVADSGDSGEPSSLAEVAAAADTEAVAEAGGGNLVLDGTSVADAGHVGVTDAGDAEVVDGDEVQAWSVDDDAEQVGDVSGDNSAEVQAWPVDDGADTAVSDDSSAAQDDETGSGHVGGYGEHGDDAHEAAAAYGPPDDARNAGWDSVGVHEHAVVDGGWSVGSAAPIEDGCMPLGHPIKGVFALGIYQVPGSSWYDQTTPDVWFLDEESAQRAGFRRGEG